MPTRIKCHLHRDGHVGLARWTDDGEPPRLILKETGNRTVAAGHELALCGLINQPTAFDERGRYCLQPIAKLQSIARRKRVGQPALATSPGSANPVRQQVA